MSLTLVPHNFRLSADVSLILLAMREQREQNYFISTSHRMHNLYNLPGVMLAEHEKSCAFPQFPKSLNLVCGHIKTHFTNQHITCLIISVFKN